MPASLGKRLAADHETRSEHQPLVQRLNQRVGRAAEIAHGRKAAQQHLFHVSGRMVGDQRVG